MVASKVKTEVLTLGHSGLTAQPLQEPSSLLLLVVIEDGDSGAWAPARSSSSLR